MSSRAVSDLFDWGDDRIGSAEIVLPAKQMVLLAGDRCPPRIADLAVTAGDEAVRWAGG